MLMNLASESESEDSIVEGQGLTPAFCHINQHEYLADAVKASEALHL